MSVISIFPIKRLHATQRELNLYLYLLQMYLDLHRCLWNKK